MNATSEAIVAMADRNASEHQEVDSRTELDSHANMPVVGNQCVIVTDHAKTVDVNAFAPHYEVTKAKLVDAAIKYSDPYSGEEYILIVMNAISVPTMRHNLIPPFIMREAGLQVNEVPKIHREDPDIDDHSIMFKETGLRIPLGLWGTFSYFPTTKPTAADLESPEEVYVLTPLRWNPHSDAYAFNEESMLDWEGNMRTTQGQEHPASL